MYWCIASGQLRCYWQEYLLCQDCNRFLAGDIIRSRSRNAKLHIRGVFGSVCRHEYPVLFMDMKHGERYLALLQHLDTYITCILLFWACHCFLLLFQDLRRHPDRVYVGFKLCVFVFIHVLGWLILFCLSQNCLSNLVKGRSHYRLLMILVAIFTDICRSVCVCAWMYTV